MRRTLPEGQQEYCLIKKSSYSYFSNSWGVEPVVVNYSLVSDIGDNEYFDTQQWIRIYEELWKRKRFLNMQMLSLDISEQVAE